MTTIVMTIDRLIEQLQGLKKDGYQYVIISPDPIGSWSAPSKKRRYYQAAFALTDEVFAKDDLNNLLNSKAFAMFFFNSTEKFSAEVREFFKKELEG